MSHFIHTLTNSWRRRDSLLCVGLDPHPARMPAAWRRERRGLFLFSREIIDATASSACAFKPQFACYAAAGAEAQLAQTIAYARENYPDIPVILDAKRGDIGSTAEHYAREAFERYGADAVTVNPYLGGDALAPFFARADKGVFVLCRTSNPGSGDFQALNCGASPLAHQVAQRAAGEWNANGNAGLVVGATWPAEIAAIRRLAGDLPLLIPGIGAQGGDLAAVLESGLNATGEGLLINVSRAIIYAAAAEETAADFAAAAATAAADFRRRINRHRRR